MQNAACTLVLLLVSQAAALDTIEAFESPWPAAGWMVGSAPRGIVDPAAAHDGFLGYTGTGGWEYNLDRPIGYVNHRLSMWVRLSSSGAPGFAYLGFDADSGGCYSLRFSATDIRFQNNSGWGFTQLSSTPVAVVPDRWYRFEVEFLGDLVRGRLFDSDGFTMVAWVEETIPGRSGGGGVAIRASRNGMHLDSLGLANAARARDDCVRLHEGFESTPWPSIGWLDLGLITAGFSHAEAAHDGSLGFVPDDLWQLNPFMKSGMPGTRLSVWVQTNSSGGPATHLRIGFAADITGCKSMVFAPDAGEIRLEDNAGWGVDVRETRTFAHLPDHWYRLEIEFWNGYTVQGRLYDSDGVTELATILESFHQPHGIGGIAFRGDQLGTMYLDTFEVHAPALRQGWNGSLWPLGTSWTQAGGGTSGTITAAASRGGHGGYVSPLFGSTWELNEAMTFGYLNDRMSLWTRGATGAAWLGFFADTGGCTSFRFAASENRVRFEDNTGWGSVTLNEVEFSPEPNTWYRLDVEVDGPGRIRGRVCAPDGHTPLVTLDHTYTPGQLGGIAVRGIGGQYLDELEDFSLGAACACPGICGDCNRSGGSADIVDALIAAQLALGLLVPTFEQIVCCDTDGSGSLTVIDALLMAQVAVGIPAALSCP